MAIIGKAETFGIKVGSVDYDFAKVIERSRGRPIRWPRNRILQKNKVDYFVAVRR